MSARRTFFTLRRSSSRAFTLLEATAVLIVLAILAGVAAFAYNTTRTSQADLAGKPILGVAHSEARKVASDNGYRYPDSLLDKLWERETSITATGGVSKIGFTAGASFAPETARNSTGGYLVSTATDGDAVAAFAVETTSDDTVGHCWTMIDHTDDTDGAATGWGFSEDVPVGQCTAAFVLECPSVAAGTAADPADAGTMTGCTGTPPRGPTKRLPAPECVTAENVGTTNSPGSALISWSPPSSTEDLSGYRILAWPGARNPSGLSEADAETGAAISFDVNDPEATSYQVPADTLTADGTYTFAVLAKGTGEQEGSTITDLAVAQSVLPRLVVDPPAAKNLLVTVDHTNLKMTLTWDHATGATQYVIGRYAGPASPTATYTEVARVPINTDPSQLAYTWTDPFTATLATRYNYRVQAVPADGRQIICGREISSGDQVRVSSAYAWGRAVLQPPTLTGAADDLVAPLGHRDDNVVTWAAVPHANAYRIYRKATDLSPDWDPTPAESWSVTRNASGTWDIKRTSDGQVTTSATLRLVDANRDHPSWTPYYGVAVRTDVFEDDGTTAHSSRDGDPVTVDVAEDAFLTVTGRASDYGVNQINWKNGGSKRYHIETSTGVVVADNYTGRTITHNAALGSQVTYIVSDMVNPALRGQVTILQFPADPQVTAQGSNRDADAYTLESRGTNRVTWTTDPKNSSYQVQTFISRASDPSTVWLEASTVADLGAGASAYDHTGLAAGSQVYYRVVARNATGQSPNSVQTATPGSTVAAYQAPAAPTITYNRLPDLASDHSQYSWPAVADLGQSGNQKFCSYAGNPGGCGYFFERTSDWWRAGESASYTSERIEAWETTPGSSNVYRVTVCNSGGCVYADTGVVNVYPGRFGFNPINIQEERRFIRHNEVVHNTTDQPGKMTIGWEESAGRDHFDVSRSWYADDPWARNIAPTRYYSTYTSPYDSTPGATYVWTVTAVAPNGLARSNQVSTLMEPSHLTMLQEHKSCKDPLNGWKLAYKWYGWEHSYGRPVQTDRIDWQWYVSKTTSANNVDQHYLDESLARWGTEYDPAQWDGPNSWVVGTKYYGFGSVAADPSETSNRYTGGLSDDKRISQLIYTGAVVLTMLHRYPSFAVDKGSTDGQRLGIFEMKKFDGNYANCSGTTWTGGVPGGRVYDQIGALDTTYTIDPG